MTHQQHPIGSGFSASSTVDDVLAGVYLTGKNVIVTGGHSGLGLVITQARAARSSAMHAATKRSSPQTTSATSS